jgi:hypothetical protein
MANRIENLSKPKPKPLRSLIGFCGIDCGECKAFVATKDNDVAMKKLIAEEWSKSYGHEVKPENINCVVVWSLMDLILGIALSAR